MAGSALLEADVRLRVNVVVHFDFGPSFKFRDQTVNDIIASASP